MIESFGFIGSILLAICAIPEVVRTIKDNKCHLGWNFLLLWFFGEVFLFIYVVDLIDYALIFNYGFNILLLIIMLIYKVKNK